MPKNMGTADRVIRIFLAAIMAVLIFTGLVYGVVAIVLGVLAAIFVLTSLVSFCPLYLPFKISTARKQG